MKICNKIGAKTMKICNKIGGKLANSRFLAAINILNGNLLRYSLALYFSFNRIRGVLSFFTKGSAFSSSTITTEEEY